LKGKKTKEYNAKKRSLEGEKRKK